MGRHRKIPGRKHRGVKDPEVQRAKREEAIKTKVNFKTHQIKTFIHKDDLVS